MVHDGPNVPQKLMQFFLYFHQEWRTLIADLHNHPSIIAWGIFNEFGPKNGWDRHHGAGGGFKHRYALKEAQETWNEFSKGFGRRNTRNVMEYPICSLFDLFSPWFITYL